MPNAVRKGSAAGHPIVTAAQRFAKAVKGTAAVQRFLHPLQNKKGEMDGSEEDQHMAGMLDAMSRAEKAMEQAADILKQLNQAAEELSMKVCHTKFDLCEMCQWCSQLSTCLRSQVGIVKQLHQAAAKLLVKGCCNICLT